MKRKWDPRSLGCDCDNCPLQDHPFPVPPQKHLIGKESRLVILGESPGTNEIAEGKPFCGASGWELERALKLHSIRRKECHVTNAILCRPKFNMPPKDWAKAIKCCKPRLDSELTSKTSNTALVMGGKALQASYGKAKITSWRGAPLKVEIGEKSVSLLPTIHPVSVLRKPAIRPIFQLDVGRGVRLADGQLGEFKWPEFYIGTDKAEQLRFLREIARAGKPIGVDVETAGINPLKAGLLALGVSNSERGVSVIWTDDKEIRDAFQECFDRCLCVTQNGSHDVLSLHTHGFKFTNGFDTLLAHAVVAPNLRHDLGFITSCFYHADRWKTVAKVEKDLKGAEGWEKWRERDPEGFKLYNVKDCAGTELSRPPLIKCLDQRPNGHALYNQYMRLQDICMKMKKWGILVSRRVLKEHNEVYSAKCTNIREEVEKLIKNTGVKGVRLGANGQHWSLRKLFFDHYGFSPKSRTTKGLPKCDKDFLESVPSSVEAGKIAGEILKFRQNYKLLSTYIRNLPIDSDNLLQADFKCWGAVTGRFSSATPNLQNQPKSMRDMFISFPGQYFISADFAGLEAVYISFLADEQDVLELYANGGDLHMENAKKILGNKIHDKAMNDLAKNGPNATLYKKTRKMCKMAGLALQYGAQPETLFRRLKKDFPTFTLPEARLMHKRYFANRPKILELHKFLEKTAEEKRYVEEPISGRRSYFNHDRVNMNAVYNFPIQAGAATLMNNAIERLAARMDWKTCGISCQVHDQLDICVTDPVKGYKDITEVMGTPLDYNGRTFTFRVDVDMGYDLLNMDPVASVEDVKTWVRNNPRPADL